MGPVEGMNHLLTAQPQRKKGMALFPLDDSHNIRPSPPSNVLCVKRAMRKEEGAALPHAAVGGCMEGGLLTSVRR